MSARGLLRPRTAVAAACPAFTAARPGVGAFACRTASVGAASMPTVCLPSAGRPQLFTRDPAFALRLTGGHGKPTRERGRPVRLGMVTVGRYWPFATHWAVQVQDTWYEVGGASKEDTHSSMVVVASQGQRSSKGADPSRFGHVGYSRRSDEDTAVFVEEWKARNPSYSFTEENCQVFARELITWLTEAKHRPLPMMDSGVGGNRKRGPSTWSGVERSEGSFQAYAGATVANVQAHRKLLNGSLQGPAASASLLLGRRGVGAFFEAELGRLEVGLGPLRVALHVNANTGAGIRNRGVEAKALGFGGTAGANGVSISSPFFTVGLGQR